MNRQPHILGASSNLLGIALLIVTGLNITHTASKTFSDEIAALAAVMLMTSCALSYLSLRAPTDINRSGLWADRTFLGGLLTLLISIVVLVVGGVD